MDSQERGEMAIKKYANRRFYNATTGRHCTLAEMHDLISEGYQLKITDCKTGEEITNVVLTQILLERDAPKLDIFPANVLHQMIRTQREFLGSVVEEFFSQVLATHRASQEQWMKFVRNTLGAPSMPANPLDWTRSLMGAFTPPAAPRPQPDQRPSPDGEMEDLRRQVADLTKQVERMAAAPAKRKR